MLRRALLMLVGLAVLLLGPARAESRAKREVREESSIDAYIREMTQPAYLVIVGSGRDFPALKKEAQGIARRIGLRFSMMDQVYDAKGLHGPGRPGDDFYDYYRRRYDWDADGKPCVSIEKSDAYPGLKPGLYIIVARIFATRSDAVKSAQSIRRIVPGAYVSKTRIYYGCIH